VENKQKEPSIKRRKNLQLSKVSDVKYSDLLELYIKECELKNLSPTTIVGYRNAHKYFITFVGEVNIMCSDVTQDLVNQYVLYLKDKYKPQTVNSYLFKVSPAIKYGINKGYIKDTIEFTHMVEQEQIKNIYTNDELKKLLEKPSNSSFADYRTWIIVNVLLCTGIRARELRELKIDDIKLDDGIIALSHTKNRKPRYIPICSTLYSVLFEYLNLRGGTGEESVFCNIYGEPLLRTTLQLGITKYAKKMGVENSGLHKFRHTFITLSVRNGMSPILLKRITGHENFKMLDRYYSFNPVDLVNVVDLYNPLESFKSKVKRY